MYLLATCASALLLGVPFSSAAAAPMDAGANDSTLRPARLVKLGLSGSFVTGRAFVPTLRYEHQLGPGWSLEAEAGYRRRYEDQGWHKRNRFSVWVVGVGIKRYSANARGALQGPYAGLGLSASGMWVRTQTQVYKPMERVATVETEWSYSAALGALGKVGLQANPGRKLALDVHLGLGISGRLTTADTPRFMPNLEVGCALGYRL